MHIRNQIILTLFLIIATLLVFEQTAIDVWVQNHFYDASMVHKDPFDRWLISKHNSVLGFWFHDTIKFVVIAFGVGCLLLFAASFKMPRFAPMRKNLLFLVCAMALVPLLVSGAKQFTNTYCPNQTTLYGGDKPYVKVLEAYPADYDGAKKGRCFPAGHATIGFELMALFFVFSNRRTRRAGLAVGLGLGWGLGIFQMLRGEHFLSHTVFSMLASWLVILLLWGVFRRGGGNGG